MRLLAPAALLLLAGCEGGIDRIRLGRGSPGKPPPEIWLTQRPKRDPKPEPAPALPAGTPVSAPPPEVYEGPVTVGLRKDGACVVAGKAVRDEEAAARLAYVRAERQKAGSADVQEMTVLVEDRVPMDRVFRAMSGGHRAGFTKIGWRLEPSIPLPEAATVAAALPPDEGRLLVSVSAEGAFKVGGKAVEASALEAALQAEVAALRERSLPVPSVSLLADRGAPPAAVKAVLDACEAAGIVSVALGSPVQVAVSGPPRSADLDFNEFYRNWKLGLESRDVDFSQGPPEYWYYCLYHAFLDEHEMTVEALGGKNFNGLRIRTLGDRAAGRLGDMAYLLNASDAGRAKALDALAETYRRVSRDAGDRAMDLELARLKLRNLYESVNAGFPPKTVSFPADVKVEPPPRKTQEKAP